MSTVLEGRAMKRVKELTTGQVAKVTGLSVETIRFYEREGLIDEPPRRASGYRQYSPETLVRIALIQRAKQLGFSLQEIRGLIDIKVSGRSRCGEFHRRVEAKARDTERKILHLRVVQKSLRGLSLKCRGRGPVAECPVLRSMEEGPRRMA